MVKIEEKKFEQIKCVLEHDCRKKISKRCAVCVLDFQYISEDPVKLACGHLICSKCKNTQMSEKANCAYHGPRKIGKSTSENKQMMMDNLNELFETMKQKFEKTIDLFEETDNEFDLNLNALSSFVKDEVDIKIESLKIDLDNMREAMWKKVDDHTEKIRKKMKTTVKIDQAKIELQKLDTYIKENNDLQVEKFYEYQKSLKDTIFEVQKLFEIPYNIMFRESEFKLKELDHVGELVLQFMEPEFNWHFFGDVENENFNPANYQLLHGLNDPGFKSMKFIGFNRLAIYSEGQMELWNQKDEGPRWSEKLACDGGHILPLGNSSDFVTAGGHTIEVFSMVAFLDPSRGIHYKYPIVQGNICCIEMIENLDENVRGSQIVNLHLACAEARKTANKFANHITIFDIQGGRFDIVHTIEGAHAHKINCMKRLPVNRFASGSDDKKIKVWRNYRIDKTLVGHESAVRDLQLLKKSELNLLVSASDDKTIRFWNYEKGDCIHIINEVAAVRQILILPDEFFTCIVGNDMLKFYETSKFKCVNTIKSKTIHGTNTKLISVELLENNWFATLSPLGIRVFDFNKQLNQN